MSDLAEVLRAFLRATGCHAAVWTQSTTEGSPTAEASSAPSEPPPVFPSVHDAPQMVRAAAGELLVAAIAGPRRAWITIGPCETPGLDLPAHLELLLPVASQFLQSA